MSKGTLSDKDADNKTAKNNSKYNYYSLECIELSTCKD